MNYLGELRWESSCELKFSLAELNFLTIMVIQKQSPGVFCKKVVLEKFANLTKKSLCRSLFSKKVPGLRSASLLKKKRLWPYYISMLSQRFFPVNFAKFFKHTFFIEHRRWLLLPILKPLDPQKQLCKFIPELVTI